MKIISLKTWMIAADGRAVAPGALDAAYLLVHEGCEVEDKDLVAAGVMADGSALAAVEPVPETAPLKGKGKK